MNDMLFDLDAVAPVATARPKAHETDMSREIAVRATLEMKAVSDAIGLWARSPRLAVDHPVLAGRFVDTWTLDPWTAINVVPRPDGDVLVRFLGEGEDDCRVLAGARLAEDGALVDFTGQRMIPMALVPAAATAKGTICVGTSFSVLRVIGRQGPWARFRPVDESNPEKDAVGLASEVIAIPSPLAVDAGPEVDDTVRQSLMEAHLKHLSTRVAKLNGKPLSWQAIRARAELLEGNRRSAERRWQAPTAEDFLPAEAKVLQPLIDLFQWSVTTEEWSAEVCIDTSAGWRMEVTIEGTHRPCGTPVEVDVDLQSDETEEIMEWFSPSGRAQATIRELDTEWKAEFAPAAKSRSGAERVGKKRGARKEPAADKEEVEELRAEVEFLRQHGADAAGAVFANAQSVAGGERPTQNAVAEAKESLVPLLDRIDSEAECRAAALLAVRCWGASDAVQARAITTLSGQLAEFGLNRPGAPRTIAEILRNLDYGPFTVEAAPGWWIAAGSDEALHGAVSCTGFYSRCSGVEEEGRPGDGNSVPKLLEHLLEEAAHGARRQVAQLVKSGDCPAAFAEWVKTLPCAPEQNAISGAARHLRALAQVRSIRANLARAVSAIAGEATTAVVAKRLFAALECECLTDVPELEMGLIARNLLQERFELGGRKERADEEELFAEPEEKIEEQEGEADGGDEER
jgi:hypothetical protein